MAQFMPTSWLRRVATPIAVSGLACALAPLSATSAVLDVEVCAGGTDRRDMVATVEVPSPPADSIADVREASRGLPFQADPGAEGTLLTVMLPGATAAGSCRRVSVLGGGQRRKVEALVSLDRVALYRGEDALRVRSRTATYFYHVQGSGLASLVDADGRDWIGYQPRGGFQGHYRGVPNIAPPDFHPGRPQGKVNSAVTATGPLRVQIESATVDRRWRVQWEFLPDHAKMTVLSKGEEHYWILYEGTPGGSFDVEWDYWRDSQGRLMPMPEPGEIWNGKLPDPQWVFFADRRVPRGLFLALHAHDDRWDEFWHRGSGGMTVFGFGRGPKPQWRYLDEVPSELTIGIVEAADPDTVRRRVESAWRPLSWRVGTWRGAEP